MKVFFLSSLLLLLRPAISFPQRFPLNFLDTERKREEVSSLTSLPPQFMPPEPPLQSGTVTATLTASTAAAKAKLQAEASMSSRERMGSGEGAPSTPSSWSLGALFQSSGGGTSESDLRTMRNR